MSAPIPDKFDDMAAEDCYDVAELLRINAALEAQVQTLREAVSEEEVHNFASYGENGYVFTEDDVNRLIAARAALAATEPKP